MPTLKRLFLPLQAPHETPWQLQAQWRITDADTLHHLLTVQRLKVNETLVGVDTLHAQVFQATVIQIHKKELILQPIQVLESPTTTPTQKITLVASLLKEQAWDVVLQKACELGVHRIQPIFSDFTTVSPKQITGKQERWQRILKESALQCESLYIPELSPPIPFEEACSLVQDSPTFVLTERHHPKTPHLMHALQKQPRIKMAQLWVGPEGGWSPDEMAVFLKDARLTTCHLNHRILRAETATIAGLSLLLHAGTDAEEPAHA
jgi:16S rRNA (uracil1498-N3)-methyltransferase